MTKKMKNWFFKNFNKALGKHKTNMKKAGGEELSTCLSLEPTQN